MILKQLLQSELTENYYKYFLTTSYRVIDVTSANNLEKIYCFNLPSLNGDLIYFIRRRYRDWLKLWTEIALVLLIVCTVASFFEKQVGISES